MLRLEDWGTRGKAPHKVQVHGVPLDLDHVPLQEWLNPQWNLAFFRSASEQRISLMATSTLRTMMVTAVAILP